MITTAVTAGVTFLLKMLGVEPSGYLIAGIAIVVKVILVVLGTVFGVRIFKRKAGPAAGTDAAAAKDVEPAAEAKEPASTSSAVSRPDR